MSKKFNCIIIEDELPATEVLKLFIADVEFLKLQQTFGSATQALSYLNTEKVDLIFLDINLPGISGISFMKMLKPDSHVIFTTAHPEYAVESFELEAVDYLLKPISFERFLKAVNRFLKIKNVEEGIVQTAKSTAERAFIFIKSDKRMVKIFLDEILYFEAQKNYLLIFTENEEYRTYQSISEMEDKIPENQFVRIHRSFIVSIPKIEGFTSEYVEIKKKRIPIGRLYSLNTTKLLKQLSNFNND